MKRSLVKNEGSPSPSKHKRSVKLEFPLEQAKLYFTPIGGITCPLVHSTEALSLSNILEIVRPINSLHFNFVIDADYLFSCYPPSLRKNPMTLVVGQSDASSLRREIGEERMKTVRIIPAHLPIPYGTHHSKLTILENEKHVHVIVSTANLISGDWEFKTQQFYHACGDKVATESSSPFQQDLLSYMEFYGKPLEGWRDTIKRVDFSNVPDRLVFSVPGYHNSRVMHNLGHLRLAALLSEQTPSSSSTTASSKSERPLYVAQCSSIGSLGRAPITWLRGEFLRSLEGNTPAPSTAPARIHVIYPSCENVRQSCEGYEAGGSLPYRNSTHCRQTWLRDLFCKWRSEETNRTNAMPHCKSYTRIENGKVLWQVVTSANLSKAAWGEVQKGGQQMCIRSYEIGVLIKDPERIRLPYDYPLVKYSPKDEPWMTDVRQEAEDIFGRRYIV